MRVSFLIGAIALITPISARAQAPSAADSAAADSTARADSIALVRELEAATDTGVPPSLPPPAGQSGPTNPRLLPDISVVGDLVADFSPKGSTQEDASRFGVREIELAFQAAVDPYFRGDLFLGISDLEGIAIEQAYLTATALPHGLEARLGRFLMPFGKQNTTHRHDLHTVEYPYVIQRFFGPEGLKGTGVYLSRVFAPLGFYQELIVTAVDRAGEAPEDLAAAETPNKDLGGLGFSARWRNYWDVNESTNFELSFSGLTSRREQPAAAPLADPTINAVLARRSVLAADATFRWRPLQRGLYKSFIVQAEFMRQLNDAVEGLDAPARDYTGAYVFARYQLTRRAFFGGRYDAVQDPELGEDRYTHAASAYFEFFPSEFSKLVAAFERYTPPTGNERLNRVLLQAAFALGPHKPHPF